MTESAAAAPKKDSELLLSAINKLTEDEARVMLEVGALFADPVSISLLKRLAQ